MESKGRSLSTRVDMTLLSYLIAQMAIESFKETLPRAGSRKLERRGRGARGRRSAGRARRSRLKGGCSQDWLPHIAASRKLKSWFTRTVRSLPNGRGSVGGEFFATRIFAACEQRNAQ